MKTTSQTQRGKVDPPDRAARAHTIFPDRITALRSLVAVVMTTVICLLFIASYAGALHNPRPHHVPLAVVGPPSLVRTLQSSAFDVVQERDAAAAARAIDRRDVYGAIIAGDLSIEVRVAPAASVAVATLLREELPPRLSSAGRVRITEVHALPDSDSRGVVPFYVAVGWVVSGYLATAFLGIAFGTRPGRTRLAWRLGSCASLGLLMGIGGTALGHGIGGLGGSWVGMAATGGLTVFAVAAATLALQVVFGPFGTAIAILIFVVLGNPSSGGPYAYELLPGFWRVVGPYIPNGAAVTGIRNISYFPAASLWPALAVLSTWALVGVAATLGFGRRAPRDSGGDAEADLRVVSAQVPAAASL